METSRGAPHAVKLCPKCAQKYRKPSKNIQIHRNLEGQRMEGFTGEIRYFLRFLFLRCRLHTVEVTGSNPVSPTIYFIKYQQDRD
jgi:hypothetical protein